MTEKKTESLNIIELDQQVEDEVRKVKEIISAIPKDRVQSRIARISMGGETLYSLTLEKLSDNTRNTPAQLEYLNAFEIAASVFRAASLELRKGMDILALEQRYGAQLDAREERAAIRENGTGGDEEENDNLRKRIVDGIFLSNRYALRFAGEVGLTLLGSEKADVKNRFSFGTKYDGSKERDELTAQLSRVAAVDLERVIEDKRSRKEEVVDEDIKYTLEGIFTSWVNQFNWDTWKDVAEGFNLQETKLKYGNYSLQAGEFKKKYDLVVCDDKFMNVQKEDAIGAEGKYKDEEKKLGTVLWNAGKILFGYNHDMRTNPRGTPPFVIFSYGEPGCGKTFVSHAYLRSLAEKFREGGRPIWIATHSVTDYASHYQNQTANALNEWGQQINDFPGVVIAYVADADMVFHSRQDPNLTIEQKQTTSVYLKLFDGTAIDKKQGRVLFVMDANYIENIDAATQSRVFDKIAHVRRFEEPSEFAALARKLIVGKYKQEEIPIAEKQWDEIGEFIYETPLSTREVTSVLGQVIGDYDWPEDKWFCSDEEAAELVQAHLAGIDHNHVMQTFDNYCSKRTEIADKSGSDIITDPNERFRRYQARVEQWKGDLTKTARDTGMSGE